MKPILLICGCFKYEKTLLKAIERFKNDKYKIIGVMANPNLPTSTMVLNIDDTRDSILLRVNTEDTYEALPFKIQAAFSWIATHLPDTPGVFKTDDDLVFESVEILADKITEHTHLDYWGVYRNCCDPGPICCNRIATRYTDTTLRPTPQWATYCYGAGYWVSTKAIKCIVNSTSVCYGSEDVMMGSILNLNGFYPEHIPISWGEEPRS